jgi:hypothetical protein
MNHESALSCLIPFFDLCNHRSSKTADPKDKVDFILQWANGEIRVSLDDEYNAGEEYDYSYSPGAGNDKLVMIYGFYLTDNPYSNSNFVMPINRLSFPKEKHIFCKEMQLYETDLEGFYPSNYQYANIEANMNKTAIDSNILKTLKVLVYPNDKFLADKEFIRKQLNKNRWINYTNEIMSAALYIDYIKGTIYKSKISYVYNINSD